MKNKPKRASPSLRWTEGESKTGGKQVLHKKSGEPRSKPSSSQRKLKSRRLICTGRHLPYSPRNRVRAKALRKRMTYTEKVIWKRLRKQNYRVLRQHPIDHYIVDFYIASAGLVIELDGKQHFTNKAIEYDKQRTMLLEMYNLIVIRFTNYQVVTNLESVCNEIESVVQSRISTREP